MLSVIIPTLDAERTLPRTLACLVAPTVQGLVREVIIADGGSRDATALIVEETGARFLTAPRGRGSQLRVGAAAARSNWLLFLHADTMLEPGWSDEASAFMSTCEREAAAPERAGVFRFALDDFEAGARALERLVALRNFLFALPYGDQGLLIPKRFYDRIGGHPDVPLMEDVAIIRKVGRGRLSQFRTAAVTSPARYKKGGYLVRPLRNFTCLSLYLIGVSPRLIARIYG
jgi:rSAM/selenodomain-associated transferase 2